MLSRRAARLEVRYSSSIDSARERYHEWLNMFPADEEHRFLTAGFKMLLTAMRNWEAYILNYFEHTHTNAFTERSNGKIKDFLRAARGSSFETGLFLRLTISLSYFLCVSCSCPRDGRRWNA